MTDDPARSRALEVLCSTDLAPIVDMVVFSPGTDTYEARAVDGRVRFRRHPHAGTWSYEVEEIDGRDPIGVQDATRFGSLEDERSASPPGRVANSYPLAYERISQLFDHPCAPDLFVLHTPAHRWESHRGEHGSLDVVQSRAPLIASGAGVARRGLVDGHCRLVDVAPTVLALLGVETATGVGPAGRPAAGRHLLRQDGEVVEALLDPSAPPADHVLVVLMDGANANVVYDAATSGRAPHLAGLLAAGSALAHGAVASLPTVTLPNHTTLLTGAHPGHHGVLHNAWYDRSRAETVVTEAPDRWQEATRWLHDGIETIHEAVKRRDPAAVTVSVNEPADRGADYSTFDYFRAGRLDRLAAGLPRPYRHADPTWFATSDAYRWGTTVDASALHQATSIWAGSFDGRHYEPPRFCWVSLSLTDSAFHEGGPYSAIAEAALADSDARLGDLLAAVERRGVRDRTAVLVVADHGMEHNAADVGGGWQEALTAAGVTCRDEASGFLYLGVEAAPGAAPDPRP